MCIFHLFNLTLDSLKVEPDGFRKKEPLFRICVQFTMYLLTDLLFQSLPSQLKMCLGSCCYHRRQILWKMSVLIIVWLVKGCDSEDLWYQLFDVVSNQLTVWKCRARFLERFCINKTWEYQARKTFFKNVHLLRCILSVLYAFFCGVRFTRENDILHRLVFVTKLHHDRLEPQNIFPLSCVDFEMN